MVEVQMYIVKHTYNEFEGRQRNLLLCWEVYGQIFLKHSLNPIIRVIRVFQCNFKRIVWSDCLSSRPRKAGKQSTCSIVKQDLKWTCVSSECVCSIIIIVRACQFCSCLGLDGSYLEPSRSRYLEVPNSEICELHVLEWCMMCILFLVLLRLELQFIVLCLVLCAYLE